VQELVGGVKKDTDDELTARRRLRVRDQSQEVVRLYEELQRRVQC
jgi:hypothetical protein